MRVEIVPEPPEPEREAILAALEAAADEDAEAGWAELALSEAVEQDELEP